MRFCIIYKNKTKEIIMKFTKRFLAFVLAALMLVSVCVVVVSAESYVLGDVTRDGKINARDYIKVKRHCLKTTTLTDEEFNLADINRDGRVNAQDYIKIKRHCLGTAIIENTLFSMTPQGDVVEIDDNVYYQYYTVQSGEANRTETVVSMEFDPADGYIPMVFSGQACNYWDYDSGILSTQYDIATQKYGYDVVGVINGSFFSMDTAYGQYGLLNGNIISNGKVVSAHAGHYDTVVAFDSDGSMNFVNSQLEFKLFLGGKEVPNGIYYINKHSGHLNGANWSNRFYYFDTSCGSNATTYAVCPGYEVVCEKVNNSELAVGDMLYGRIIEIKENSYGTALSDGEYDMSDKFVLFVADDSPYASYVEDLVLGDIVNIQVNETVAASKEIMENANSVIPNVGFLVKDGVDQTQIKSTIGTHDVTLAARWTAFGQKADGSYVFFTSEGGSTGETSRSITLRDVAKFMIEKGCVNVIRMDGGGSSAMYVKDTGDGEPGYLQSSTRDVGDCILVVKADSTKSEDLENILSARIAEAKAIVASEPNATISAAIAEAEAILALDNPVSGDVRREICDLDDAMSGRDRIADLIEQANGVKFTEFSVTNLDALRNAYADAVAALNAPDVTYGESKYICDTLEALLETKGEGELVENGIFITGFNSSILAGDATIFTPDFGEISHSTANHKWTQNMILTWDDLMGGYVVTEMFHGNGDAKTVNLEENQLFIALHRDSSVPDSIPNMDAFSQATVGQRLIINGIDIENKTIGFLAYIKFV